MNNGENRSFLQQAIFGTENFKLRLNLSRLCWNGCCPEVTITLFTFRMGNVLSIMGIISAIYVFHFNRGGGIGNSHDGETFTGILFYCFHLVGLISALKVHKERPNNRTNKKMG